MKTMKQLQRSETRSIEETVTNRLNMRKFRLSFVLITLISISSLFFSSCKKKDKSPAEQLKGMWILDKAELITNDIVLDDSTQYFLSLNITSGESKLVSNLLSGPDKVDGSWSLSNDTINFTYKIPHFVVPVDSTVIQNDENGNSTVGYFFKGILVGTASDEIISMENALRFAKIISKDEQHLTIYVNNLGTLYLTKEVLEKPGISFISVLRGLLGMAFLLCLAWVFSSNRKAIDWSLVAKGVGLQFIIAILLLYVPGVADAFDFISKGFLKVISYTDDGFNFLFGSFITGEVGEPLYTFAFKILPTIIFFSALMSLFYYWGILQKIVYGFAWLMKRFMNLSGAESMAAAGNVFLGQTEAPLLIKPYLLGMTKSEVMCLMTGGMATIAGGVLASYIGFLGGDDPEQQIAFARHLLTASIISAPAAIVAAKILVPETEDFNKNLTINKDKIGTNALEAISNGTTDGLKLAVNVGATLLVFIALMALANGLLGYVGRIGGLNEWIASNTAYDQLSFQFLLGYAGYPIVWMMGFESNDCVFVGELLGQKTVINEYIAYNRLAEMKRDGLLSEKSIVMATYMLCGFANFASIGIQIGGIGALVPSRKGLLSQLGVKALIGGTIACLLTAVVVGMTM